MKLFYLLLHRLQRCLKLFVKFFLVFIVLLIVFANFYSYSSLTRFVYSIEWLLIYTPLIQNGDFVVPPAVSMAFQHLHSFKILLSKASSCLFDDGFPDFEGKYHWTRNELNYCQTKDELFRGQVADPRFQCFVHRMLLMHIKSEVLSIDPPVVKYHDFLGAQRNEQFLRETENITLNQAKIQVKDSLDRDIWQDSLVINGTFVSRHYSTSISNSFDFMQERISAFNLEKAETLHIKRYRAGGHYSPHLDYLLVNPEPWMGNRIATFMVILKPAEAGGGTIFPNVGVNFKPRAGDAIIWLNSKPNYEVAQDSFHGACPVLSGVKVGVTIWIRSVGQELRLPCPLEENKPFDYKLLTHPKQSQRQFWTYTECSWRKALSSVPLLKQRMFGQFEKCNNM